ncbi:mitochondrial 39-S ribosomal protein L47 (MRP-L47)-domain-containing protein [Russula brevipes]|nr:mitochondrial 39-S ribosomal protein L47 (MRP-L47)-domain-containing protein [Russula brevipes]
MLSSLRVRTSNAVRALGRVRRYSTPVDITPRAGETSGAPGALRPHLNIPANPNHGLYAFFRKREKDGKVTHDSLEDDAGLRDIFGRAWSAAELRRKSFRDLHTLWYVLLRERNLIATQMESYRRVRNSIHLIFLTPFFLSSLKCRKSMARIKYVINERRLAYEGAMKIHAEKSEQAAKKGTETETETVVSDDSSHFLERHPQKVPPLAEDSLFERSRSTA